MQSNQTRFAQLIAEHELSESQEETLAKMMALVFTAEQRTPTADERIFFERFAPRVDEPMEELADGGLSVDTFSDVDKDIGPTLLTVAHAGAMVDDAACERKQRMLGRIGDSMQATPAEMRRAAEIAREFIVERRLRQMYLDDGLNSPRRTQIMSELSRLGASNEVVSSWESRLRKAYEENALEAMDARHEGFHSRKMDQMLERHDPARRGTSSGVFGSS